jgi:glucokinase
MAKCIPAVTGTAGEIGHMVIDDDGPVCPCGNIGCWQTLASGTALAQKAVSRVEKGAISSILDLAGGKMEMITAETVGSAASAGDKLAMELIEKTGYYIGVGLANLVNIFNPGLIVIGGGLSELGDILVEPAYREAKRRAFAPPYKQVRFKRAGLGADSVVIGAAFQAMDMMHKEGNR